MVQNLSPNTRYEFVVRLHVDQTSSAWSPVVFHRTLPAGNEWDTQVTSYCTTVRPSLCRLKSDEVQTVLGVFVYREWRCAFTLSTQPATWGGASDSDRGRHRSGVLEGTHRAQRRGDTLHHPVRFSEGVVGRTLANNAEGGWVAHREMLTVNTSDAECFESSSRVWSHPLLRDNDQITIFKRCLIVDVEF